MKKHQLTAMVLSVLTAGIVIGCSKPNDASSDNAAADVNKTADDKKADDGAVITTASDSIADNAVENASTKVSSNHTSTTELEAKTIADYLTHVASGQIVPAYNNVAKQSQALNKLATQHCQAGTLDEEKLALLREQWLELAKAWANAEIVNFGPAMDSMSNLYTNYFPDERGLVHQGVIDLIAANPQLTPEQLASESAVVQGIPGMEEVLYANDTLDAGQCRYIISASQALTDRLNNAQNQWQQSATTLLGLDNANNSNSNSPNSKLGLNRWINSVLALIETTKSRSLDQPLGLTGSKKGHLPADAAGESRAILTAKVAALNQALTDPKLLQLVANRDQDTLTDEIATQLAQTSTILAKMPDDIAKASPDQQRALYDQLTKVTLLIKHQLMPVLGVQVGFNSTDGD